MSLESRIREIYNSNNQLILFAEAKNIGLIAFNAVIIFGTLALLNKIFTGWLYYLAIYIVVMNLISVVISLTSLTAQRKPRNFTSSQPSADNLLFFGTAAFMTPDEYLRQLTERYHLKSENKLLEHDLARQVVTVSRIANRKFTRFNTALSFTLSSIITPVGFLIYYFAFYPNRRRS